MEDPLVDGLGLEGSDDSGSDVLECSVHLPAGLLESLSSVHGLVLAVQRISCRLGDLIAVVERQTLDPVFVDLISQFDSLVAIRREMLKKGDEVRSRRAQDFRECAEMVLGSSVSLLNLLKRHGLVMIAQVDVTFDPDLHEVARVEKDSQADSRVLSVVQPGFVFEGRVLRKAKVVVSRLDGGLREGGSGICLHSDTSLSSCSCSSLATPC